MATAITQRTATGANNGGSGTFSIALPIGMVAGDILICAVAVDSGTQSPTMTNWSLLGKTSIGGGTGSGLSIFALIQTGSIAGSQNVTNVGSHSAVAVMQALTHGDTAMPSALTTPSGWLDQSTSSTDTTSNTTLTTPAITSNQGGDYEIMFASWTSGAIATAAGGSTLDTTQAQGSAMSLALFHNNTSQIAQATAVSAFSHSLNSANASKIGVSLLISVPQGPFGIFDPSHLSLLTI